MGLAITGISPDQGLAQVRTMKPLPKLDDQHPSPIDCEQCGGRGYIAQWIVGKPQFKHMGRCEQCSGFGRVK